MKIHLQMSRLDEWTEAPHINIQNNWLHIERTIILINHQCTFLKICGVRKSCSKNRFSTGTLRKKIFAKNSRAQMWTRGVYRITIQEKKQKHPERLKPSGRWALLFIHKTNPFIFCGSRKGYFQHLLHLGLYLIRLCTKPVADCWLKTFFALIWQFFWKNTPEPTCLMWLWKPEFFTTLSGQGKSRGRFSKPWVTSLKTSEQLLAEQIKFYTG